MANNTQKISAYLVVYNEEAKIETCLKNLQGVVDEIILIHDGECSDKTLEIAKKYTKKIFVRPHHGNAEPHRPFAIAQCENEWVLQLDADEKISTDLQKALPSLIEDNTIDAYSFDWVAEIGTMNSCFMKKLFLFRKSKMYLVALPHMQCETRGTYKHVKYTVHHDTTEFISTFKLLKRYLKKDFYWSKVTASMLSGSLDNIPTYNCSIHDDSLRQMRKIKFIQSKPYLAIFAIPVYSFLNAYLRNGVYRQGLLGFVLSCHVPLHSFFLCYHLLKTKLLRRSI